MILITVRLIWGYKLSKAGHFWQFLCLYEQFVDVLLYLLPTTGLTTPVIYSIKICLYFSWTQIFSCPKAVTAVRISLSQGLDDMSLNLFVTCLREKVRGEKQDHGPFGWGLAFRRRTCYHGGAGYELSLILGGSWCFWPISYNINN